MNIIEKCDLIFSHLVRAIDKEKCFTCGFTSKYNQNGHLFTRKLLSLRYNIYNCHCQCPVCNMKHNNHPDLYKDKFIIIYGYKKYKELNIKKSILLGMRKYDYIDLFDLLKLHKKKNKSFSRNVLDLELQMFFNDKYL